MSTSTETPDDVANDDPDARRRAWGQHWEDRQGLQVVGHLTERASRAALNRSRATFELRHGAAPRPGSVSAARAGRIPTGPYAASPSTGARSRPLHGWCPEP